MKKKICAAVITTLVLLCTAINLKGQEKINLNNIRLDIDKFIFYGKPNLEKCDHLGGNPGTKDQYSKVAAEQYSTFTIHNYIPGKDGTPDKYVIQFLEWGAKRFLAGKRGRKNDLENIAKFNRFTPEATGTKLMAATANNSRFDIIKNLSGDPYFLISKADLLEWAFVYKPVKRAEASFGTISYLTRMRPRHDSIAGRWFTDVNLGMAFGPRINMGNWSISLMGGLSVAKVVIDSISTRGFLGSSKEHVSLAPSANLMIAYKNIGLVFGIGMDWVNEDATDVKKWIYNRQIFYAVGIGINIFNSGSQENTTAKADQK